ncbi:aminotransferase class I/II-fold pyridoxal phosphate-dependent enzyme, partial [Candidatus Bathyarchaeota archaeon]|nr:aminotransferase class I/II-fold pyridoxal phosphate-dependent enzyme [Candidatus Bathyarchaeota archaeon]
PFISYAILAVTDYGQGHEVLCPNPGYPIYESQARAHGTIPVPIPLLEKNDYSIDIEHLERKINERSRLLILNSPHNPTGAVLEEETLKQIAEVVQKYDDLWIFSDEVYSRIIYNSKFTSIASIRNMAERTIVVDAVSKTYAMTGWRIGFAANRRLSSYISQWVNNTDSCAAHPSQYAATEALNGPQAEVDEMVESYQKRRDLIVEGLNSIKGIECPRPRGTFYAWPNITGACKITGTTDSEDFRQHLLDDAGVAVLSDIHFGDRNTNEGQHIRFSFATSCEQIEEGIRRIAAYVDKT